MKGLMILLLVVCAAVGGWLAYAEWKAAPDARSALYRGQYVLASRYLAAHSRDNNHDAQVRLGNLYYLGLGVEQDFSKALQWYTQSAMAANVAAQYNVGIMFQQGLGLPPDPIQAVAWFLLADENGNEQAQIKLRKLSGSLNPNKIQEALALQASIEQEINDNISTTQ